MKLTGFGYTLIELVIAIAAIGILGIILTDTFVQNLRGQKKVAIITQVKQSGQGVLDRLTNQIKGAEKVVCNRVNTANGRHFLVVAQKGVYHRFVYVPATSTANGYIGYDNPPTTVTLSDNSTILTNPCNEEIDAPFDTLNNSAIKLTDTNTVSGVSIKKSCDIGSSCNNIFSKTTGANGKDAIAVDFKVDVGVEAGTTVENLVSEGGVRFNTTIQLR